MKRVLIGCERSGVVRRAFEERGFDAWSCDIEPADDRSNRHIRGNVLDHLDDSWDLLAVMHPPCTVLCNSGAKWLYIGGKKINGPDPKRWTELHRAAAFYRALRDAKQIPHRAVENPIMHRHAISLTKRGFVQFVQPWWFGDPYLKATGLELVNLPPLAPTDQLTPPRPGTAEHKAWSRVHRHSGWGRHAQDRARARSQTYPGLANAMSDQWGAYISMRLAA
ncbi:hypothetical protein SAMN06295912_102284 [Sphingomonas laterariae]|uniref:DNA (Cytosine-5)-methyltransferase 1 n=1 Tax=Edaphosphingomonas laterariae TaxID=861865 RepID=A0A239CMM2_9SPHN|nr:hypothetical protein [Sphingomonas laterariae]SNS21112.1 hypothetical protein SAMN06295912_102284 [Sphingomonas laterariae]